MKKNKKSDAVPAGMTEVHHTKDGGCIICKSTDKHYHTASEWKYAIDAVAWRMGLR